MFRSILLLIISMAVLIKSTSAQIFPPNFNLVSNGGFELYDESIGSDTSFETNKSCWITSNKLAFPMTFSTPFNNHILRAHSGLRTLRMQTPYPYLQTPPITWIDTTGYNGRPYPQTKLLEPLVAGLRYYFTMYIGVGKKMKGFSVGPSILVANIGVLFSKKKVSDYSTYGRINFIPQINFTDWDLPIEDSLIYINLSATYVATGGEEYMTIGNFDYFNNLKFIYAVDDKYYGFVTFYPLIDDISLVRDTTQPMISLDKFSLGNDTTLCNGDTMRIGGEPHFFGYNWNTGDTSRFININKPGTYWCSADFGCNTVTDTIVVSASVAPAPFNIKDTALCEAVLPISISAPYTAAAYLWSNGSTAFTTSFNSIGKQWLRISNACGDQHFTDTFDIKSLNVSLNNINLGKDTNNCLYGFFLDTISLQVLANSATQIKWSNGSSNNSLKVWEPGAYWVQVSNVCYTVADTINITGCAARDVPKVDIPNAFTPNGDGKNEVFRLKYLPQQVVSFNLKIYNRYGQMISELRNRSDYWDGGNYELGVYYYLFVYKDISGKEYMQKGDISLLR